MYHRFRFSFLTFFLIEIANMFNLKSFLFNHHRYMKYLYPYECDKLKLSNPGELQSAIDGNRREGRRSSYGYDLSPGPTLVPSTLNGGLMNGKMGRGSPGNQNITMIIYIMMQLY